MQRQRTSFKALLTVGGLVAAGLAVPLFVVPRFLEGSESLASSQAARIASRAKGSFLTCAAVRDRARDFVKLHYSVRQFDEEISSRTFEKFFQSLDPGRNFFLQKDIDGFRANERKLGELVGRTDCRFISDVYALYLKRIDESAVLISEALANEPNFGLDEKIETDRKKIAWAKDPSDLKERWRKLLKFNAMSMMETEKDWAKTRERLEKRYTLARKSFSEKSTDDVHGIFLNAFALSLDPHSAYYMPEDQDEFKVAFSLQLVGIGASLSQQDGYTVVEALIAGGAAMRDGRLQKGDKIVAVDPGDGNGFTDVVDMDLSKVVMLIRGKKDTRVVLQVLRKNEKGEIGRTQIELVRDVVHLADSEARSDVMTVRGKKIGVINLPSFYIDYAGSRSGDGDFRSSAGDVAREVTKLKAQGVSGIVVDLRRNGGGDLGECIRMTGLFIDKGPVVQTQGRGGDVESSDDKDAGVAYTGPLAVMISKQSASASEIFAGAMQDYGRGVIVGNSRTYGKATVQNVIEVPGSAGRESDGAVKVTISKFFRPSGRSNQERGVPADVTIPDVFEVADVSEGENDFVLPYTTISPQKHFRPLQDFGTLIPALRQRSQMRVKATPAFKEVFDAIEKARKEQENTLLSLKIEKRAKTTPTPAATPTANPGAGTGTAEGSEAGKVIVESDIQLREAGEILVDSIELLNGKSDWTH
ncbi:MAG: carboxy terminal-processing peptidase [Silvanigrellales bacterium]|nr:carboxy terminal-processing peptidase [Silvanigrellales bacterium]